MAGHGVLLFVVVGQDDRPIYEADLSGRPTDKDDRPQYLHHFVLHASLDALEEVEWLNGAGYLGVIDRFNALQVSAFVTASRTRLLLLHDGRPDDAVKNFFKDVHELYLRAALNPFFSASMKLTSTSFHQRVKHVARACFR